jgi:hypothetical protein
MPRRDGSPLVGQAGVLRCRSCGSLLLAGDEDIHERLHPRISCGQAHPHWGVAHISTDKEKPWEGHPWEEQFER